METHAVSNQQLYTTTIAAPCKQAVRQNDRFPDDASRFSDRCDAFSSSLVPIGNDALKSRTTRIWAGTKNNNSFSLIVS